MPGSRNVKLDALSWQFSTHKEKQDPEPILPATCTIGAITWEIELAVQEIKSRTGSRRRTRRAIFVPSTIHSRVPHWAHTARFICHLEVNRMITFLQRYFL